MVEIVFKILKPVVSKIFDATLEFYRRHLDERRYVPARFLKMKGLTDEIGQFDPFLSSRNDQIQDTSDSQDPDAVLWTRNNDLCRFNSQIAAASSPALDIAKDHANPPLIITGPSGAGKTIFLTRFVEQQYLDRFVRISEYLDFVSTLISRIPCRTSDLVDTRTSLAGEFDKFIKTAAAFPIGEVLDNFGLIAERDSRLPQLLVRTNDFLRNAMEGRETTLFVFDQIERFLVDIKFSLAHAAQSKFSYQVYFLIVVLKALRGLKNARLVFSIREDALFESVDFLTYSLDRPADADRGFRYMYFSGINTKDADPGVIDKIRKKFEKTKAGIKPSDLDRFLTIQNRSVSNTFFIQLTGYMLEHFGSQDKTIAEKIEKDGIPSDLLPLFFDQLIAGFYRRHPASISYDVLRVVLITIAIENKYSGDPVTPKRISLLAHLPLEYVQDAVADCIDIGILHSDQTSGGAVRFAHDMLFDFIVQSEAFMVRDDLQKSIERLSERRIPNQDLIDVKQFGAVLADAGKRDWGALAIMGFVTYGFILSFSSWGFHYDFLASAPICTTLHGFWQRLLGGILTVDTCDSMKWYYWTIYLADCAWVIFIYRVDAGYFRHVFSEKKIPQAISMSLPIVGAISGLFVSFTPVLTVVPIALFGSAMAGLLIYIYVEWGGRDNSFAQLNGRQGAKIAMNMGFMLFLIPLHWFMVTDKPVFAAARDAIGFSYPFTARNLTFWATAVFFLWFWFHIHTDQQGDVAIATRLAVCDAVKKRHVA